MAGGMIARFPVDGRQGAATPNVVNTVKVKQFARSVICWCLVFVLVSLTFSRRQEASFSALAPPSLRQKISILPAHTSMNQVIEQKRFSFRYPYIIATKVQNKEVHTKNGNPAHRGKPICICYWNKGSLYLINKREDIKEIINTHKPLVLGLGEAQFKSDHDLAEVQQPGFTLHLDSSQASLGVSRCAVYTHESLAVKRRHDLETEGIYTVWLQLGLPHQKEILVMCGYRCKGVILADVSPRASPLPCRDIGPCVYGSCYKSRCLLATFTVSFGGDE